MSRVIENTAFPSAMEVKLRRIRWRQVGLAVARAVAIAASVLIAAMLVAMLADWWFVLFDTGVRLALTVASLSLAVAVLLMVGIRPVIYALGWTRAAHDADAEVPQLEERWTTISHFAKSDYQPTTKVAKAMLQQVISEAVALGTLVEPARVVRVARLRKVLIVASACVVVLVGFLAVNWEQNSVLLRRFWAPMAQITATQLECVTGDAAIPRGRPMDIVTRLSGLKRDAATLMLVTESDESKMIVLASNPDVPNTFTHHVTVDESFRYRVSAGDGRSEWHSITAIDPPEIAAVRLTVTAPDYVDRPPYEKSLLPSRVKAIQGSRLTLEIRSAAELESFELLLGRDDQAGEAIEQTLVLSPESDGWYRFETLLEQDLSLSPILHSPFGLTNEDRRICRIQVIPDKAPVARVISPTEEMSVSPDEVIDIKFEAHDDHGIAKAELIVYQEFENGDREVLRVQDIPLDEQQLEKHILGTAKLDLSEFALDDGTNISYAVRVTDNRMLNLDPKDAAARKSGDDEPAAAESKTAEEAGKDATSVAQSTDSQDSSREIGELPSAAAMAVASELSDSENTSQESPGESQLAKADVAESAKEGVRVGTDKEKTPVAKADAQGESNNNEPTIPDDPTAVAADKGDGPMPSENPDSTDGEVATSKGGSPPATSSDSPPAGDDKSDSSAVAAASSKPTENTENDKAQPAGGSPNPQTPTAADPQLAKGGSGAPQTPQDSSPPEDPSDPLPNTELGQPASDSKSSSGSVQLSEISQSRSSSSTPSADLRRDMKFESQRGQNTESNRLRLTITAREAVAANPGSSRPSDAMNTRELLQRIDKELEAAELTLLELNQQPDLAAVPERSQQVDARLEKAEQIVADLRNDTKETKYAFVGLQMLDIGRTHLTPARDRMYVLIQDPGLNPARNILEALHHTTSAREQIEALTKRFEAVARERELAEDLEEVAKIYEVYVENMQNVLREAQQNQNPLRRKMAIVEVDEAYLKRYTQVLEMRRELMAEFGRILGDDPRLMGKYMDLIKRRGGNLRNQLTDLRERQEDISIELSGWLRVDESQRPDVWIQVAEMRLLAVKQLVNEALQLESRTLSQLPLNLESDAAAARGVVGHAKEVALKARQNSLKAKALIDDALRSDDVKIDLLAVADELAYELVELDAALEQLAFEHEGNEETADFVTKRLAESRSVAEQAIAWAEVVSHVRHDGYHGLAAIDQHKLAIATDRLRIAMSSIEDDLRGTFQSDDIPPEVANIVRELLMVMETITFNQAAATYELENGQLESAEVQQTMATEGFERAEELFDKMRRKTVEILDQREVDNPNIADLIDPTLDEFLERLEREPDLNQLLGIPNRPRNLRVIQDWMLWQSQGQGGGGGDGEAGSSAQQAAANAMQRAQQMAQRKANEEEKERPAANDGNLTEEEMRKFAAAEKSDEEMEKMLRAIEEKIKDPATNEEQRKELQEKAKMLALMLQDARNGNLDSRKWQELVAGDELKAMLEALASGQPIPDSQWNRLLSTLDTGLWQVRGRTPPEDYRKAIEQYQDQIRRLLNAEDAE